MGDGMDRSIVLKLYPNREQEKAIDRQIEHLRYVYNACLYILKHRYLATGKVCSRYDLNDKCNEMRKRNAWLRSSYASCLYDAAGRALQAFRKRLSDSVRSGSPVFPRARAKGEMDSFLYISAKDFKVYDEDDGGKTKRYVKLGKVPGSIRARNLSPIKGAPRTLRVKRRDMGTHYEYQCSLVYRLPEDYTEGDPEDRSDREDVGIDLGLRHVACFSDGRTYDLPEDYTESQRRRDRLRSRYEKAKGTPGEKKARSRFVHANDRVLGKRKALIDRIVHDALHGHRDVYIERLNVAKLQGRSKGKRMRRMYEEASLGTLIRTLLSKARLTCSRVVAVDPRNTSKLCSACGAMVEKTLSDRVHSCPVCGLVTDRDLNAAINILKRGLAGSPSL